MGKSQTSRTKRAARSRGDPTFDEMWSLPAGERTVCAWFVQDAAGKYVNLFERGAGDDWFLRVDDIERATVFPSEAEARQVLADAGDAGQGLRIVGPLALAAETAGEWYQRQIGLSLEVMPDDVVRTVTDVQLLLQILVSPNKPFSAGMVLARAYKFGCSVERDWIQRDIAPHVESDIYTPEHTAHITERLVRAGLAIVVDRVGREQLRRLVAFERLRSQASPGPDERLLRTTALRAGSMMCEAINSRLLARRQAEFDKLVTFARAIYEGDMHPVGVLMLTVLAGLGVLLGQSANDRRIDLTFPENISLEEAGDVVIGLGAPRLMEKIRAGSRLH